MMLRRTLFCIFLICWSPGITPAGSVFAHAILLKATPAANATISGPDVMIWLEFNVRIDAKRSRIICVLPDGTSVPLKVEAGAPDKISAKATGLRPGPHKLRWQVLASDGHISNGVVPFQVK